MDTRMPELVMDGWPFFHAHDQIHIESQTFTEVHNLPQRNDQPRFSQDMTPWPLWAACQNSESDSRSSSKTVSSRHPSSTHCTVTILGNFFSRLPPHTHKQVSPSV